MLGDQVDYKGVNVREGFECGEEYRLFEVKVLSHLGIELKDDISCAFFYHFAIDHPGGKRPVDQHAQSKRVLMLV